jgi:hypothetical protein
MVFKAVRTALFSPSPHDRNGLVRSASEGTSRDSRPYRSVTPPRDLRPRRTDNREGRSQLRRDPRVEVWRGKSAPELSDAEVEAIINEHRLRRHKSTRDESGRGRDDLTIPAGSPRPGRDRPGPTAW